MASAAVFVLLYKPSIGIMSLYSFADLGVETQVFFYGLIRN